MNKELHDNIRIIIIKENGDIDIIFSANDYTLKNLIELNYNDNFNNIFLKYNSIKKTVNFDLNDKHLFYLKQYLSNHFVDEFRKINYNPQYTTDDLMLYYRLTSIGNIMLINSSEHYNILAIPNLGITEEQKNKLNDIKSLFNNEYKWSLADNMHIEVEEKNGCKYGFLDVGLPIEGTINEVIDTYLEKNDIKKR